MKWPLSSPFLHSPPCSNHMKQLQLPGLPCSHTCGLGDSCFCCSFGEFLFILQDSSVISFVQPSLTCLPPSSTGSAFSNVPVLPVLTLILVLIILNDVCLHICLPIRLGDPGGQRPFLNYLCILSTWHFAWYLVVLSQGFLHRNPYHHTTYHNHQSGPCLISCSCQIRKIFLVILTMLLP